MEPLKQRNKKVLLILSSVVFLPALDTLAVIYRLSFSGYLFFKNPWSDGAFPLVVLSVCILGVFVVYAFYSMVKYHAVLLPVVLIILSWIAGLRSLVTIILVLGFSGGH